MLIDKLRFNNPAISPYFPVDSDCVLYNAYWDGTALDHSIYGNNGILVNSDPPVASFGADGLVISGSSQGSSPAGVTIPYSSGSIGGGIRFFTDNLDGTMRAWLDAPWFDIAPGLVVTISGSTPYDGTYMIQEPLGPGSFSFTHTNDGQSTTGRWVYNISSLNFTDNFSVEGWLKIPADNPTPIFPVLCSQGINDAGPPGLLKFWVGRILFGGGGSARLVSIHYYDLGGSTYFISSVSVPPNNFYHIVSTYSSTMGAIYFYVNGIRVAGAFPVVPIHPAANSTGPIGVGYIQYPTEPIYQTRPCTIGELRIWKKILIQSDVTSIFNATKARYI
jgi:hypothetical protein